MSRQAGPSAHLSKKGPCPRMKRRHGGSIRPWHGGRFTISQTNSKKSRRNQGCRGFLGEGSCGPIGMRLPHWRQFFQCRKAHLAWLERSEGKKVPARVSESAARGRDALPGFVLRQRARHAFWQGVGCEPCLGGGGIAADPCAHRASIHFVAAIFIADARRFAECGGGVLAK